MKPSDYPQRMCREAVFNRQGMAYICELPDLHVGPCMSQSVRDSMQRRVAWEGEHPDQVSTSRPSPDIIFDDPRGPL